MYKSLTIIKAMAHSQRRQKYWPITALAVGGAAAAAAAAAYFLYQYFQQPTVEDLDTTCSEQLEKSIRYTNRPITIILTESILSAKLPLVEILSKTENIVLVIPPDLSIQDLQDVCDSISFKIIECDTDEGVWSVVKHLKSEIVFVVPDDLNKAVPEDVARFVHEVVKLEQNNTEINGQILSYIIT